MLFGHHLCCHQSKQQQTAMSPSWLSMMLPPPPLVTLCEDSMICERLLQPFSCFCLTASIISIAVSVIGWPSFPQPPVLEQQEYLQHLLLQNTTGQQTQHDPPHGDLNSAEHQESHRQEPQLLPVMLRSLCFLPHHLPPGLLQKGYQTNCPC